MGAFACKECGALFPKKPREIHEVAGTLVPVDRDAMRYHALEEEHGCRTLHDWQVLARKRGFKPGWAWHRWMARQKGRSYAAR
jgi:hypothetical protein